MKTVYVFGIVFRSGDSEKTRFVETEEPFGRNIVRAVDLLAEQGVAADEIIQITELNSKIVYEASKQKERS